MDEDVFEICKVLADAGFASVAAEVIAAVSEGKPELSEANQNDLDQSREGTGRFVAIPRGKQLEFAVKYLHERLVEPAYKFAEAERIAGELSDSDPILIEVLDDEARSPRPQRQSRAAHGAGSARPAEQLGQALNALISAEEA